MFDNKLLIDPIELEFFIELIEENKSAMMQTARAILTGRYAGFVDDAIQNALISIAKNVFIIKNRIECSKRRAFCVRVVKNKAIDIIRRERDDKQSLDSIEFVLCANTPDPLDEVITAENYRQLAMVIESLDENYKTVLKYKLIDGLSDNEIASLLNITAKNVNVRTFRAKKKLRELLKGDGGFDKDK